jgi:uncharacterized MAPEG superfamily protein
MTILITSLKLPLAALILGCLFFVCKLIYTIGYVVGGPNLRGIGAYPIIFIVHALFALSLYTAAEYMKMYNQNVSMSSSFT